MSGPYAFLHRTVEEEFPTHPGAPIINKTYKTTSQELKGYGPATRGYSSLYYYGNSRAKIAINGQPYDPFKRGGIS